MNRTFNNGQKRMEQIERKERAQNNGKERNRHSQTFFAEAACRFEGLFFVAAEATAEDVSFSLSLSEKSRARSEGGLIVVGCC